MANNEVEKLHQRLIEENLIRDKNILPWIYRGKNFGYNAFGGLISFLVVMENKISVMQKFDWLHQWLHTYS